MECLSVIPKYLGNYAAPKRRRLLEMLIQSVPYLIDSGSSNPQEDHHAILDLQERLGCNPAEARCLLKFAMNEFPSLKIIPTGEL